MGLPVHFESVVTALRKILVIFFEAILVEFKDNSLHENLPEDFSLLVSHFAVRFEGAFLAPNEDSLIKHAMAHYQSI